MSDGGDIHQHARLAAGRHLIGSIKVQVFGSRHYFNRINRAQNRIGIDCVSYFQAAMQKILKQEALNLFPIHIEVETGMNRLGFSFPQIPDLLKQLTGNVFHVQSVFSHLAASEEAQQDAFTQHQFENYQSIVQRIQGVLGYPFIRHITNSSAAVRSPALQ